MENSSTKEIIIKKPFKLFVEKLPNLKKEIEAIKLQTEEEGDYSLIMQFTGITMNYNTATGELMIMTLEKMSKYNHNKSSFYFCDINKGLSADGFYPTEFVLEEKDLINKIKKCVNKGLFKEILLQDFKDKENYQKMKKEDGRLLKKMIESKFIDKRKQYVVKNPKKILEELLNDYL